MPKTVKLSDPERALLEWFAAPEQDGYQVNTWAIKISQIEAASAFTLGMDLQSLKRRGLLDAEGRGNNRQWWITDAGKEALKPEEAAS